VKKIIAYTILLLFALPLLAQQSILDDYISLGLSDNLALKQKQTEYQKQFIEIQKAKGYFLPSVTLNARYSIARGGRTIDFPVGDMMNPVYANLEFLNAQVDNPFSAINYPELENEEIYFLRPTEQETKLQLIQPLFNTKIYYNYKIQEDKLNAKEADIMVFKRELVYMIKEAYFNHLKAIEYKHLLEISKDLIDENIRVSKSLVKNNIATKEVIYQAEAELAEFNRMLADADKMITMTRSYFNYLCSRDFDTDIIIDPSYKETNYEDINLLPKDQDVTKREELYKIEHYMLARDKNLLIKKYENLPVLVAVVDYGFQGEKYSFSADDDFFMTSFVLQWDLFKGFQRKEDYELAMIERENLDLKKEEVIQQISLQILDSYEALKADLIKWETTFAETKATEEAYKIIERKYKENMVNYLELTFARTQMIQASEKQIIAKFDYLIQEAYYERACATYNIESSLFFRMNSLNLLFSIFRESLPPN
jgi:outer membrane protein TolC